MKHPVRYAIASALFLLTSLNAEARTPKLVVVIVADQMRADYWLRFKPLLKPDGVRRFMDQGTYFPNAAYDYAATKTSPGHVLIGDGLYPKDSGIIGNEWYDRGDKRETTSIEQSTDTYPAKLRWFSGKSLADRVKQSYPTARIFSLSIKDRAALLLGGPNQDQVVWFDSKRDSFVAISSAPPVWLSQANQELAAFKTSHGSWASLPDLKDKDFHSYSVVLKTPPPSLIPGSSFSHPTPLVSTIIASPYADELLESLVEKAVLAEQLGNNPAGVPDVLMLSFSSIDLVGHVYGPDSPEMMDTFLRFDRDLSKLLHFVEKNVGRENVAFVLTADHGVTAIPEVSRAKGMPAVRVSLSAQKMPHPAWIEAVSAPYVYINEDAVHVANVTTAQATAEVRLALLKMDGVQMVYTDDQILKGQAPVEITRSFYLGHSGNLYVVLRPYCIFADGSSGTTHGQPTADDQAVPIAFYGFGIPAKRVPDPVSPAIIAPTVLKLLGISTDGLSTPYTL